MKRLRVLIADDHVLVRAGLRTLLEKTADLEVVGEASNGHEAAALAGTCRPDVVLMDIAMPEGNGLQAAAKLRRENVSSRVLILSMSGTVEDVRRALDAGAHGFLLKSDSPGVFLSAIRAVAAGQRYFSPDVKEAAALALAAPGKASPLTPRQCDILRLVAEGNTSQAIADYLGISVNTVETHRRKIMEALDIHDIAGLVRYALRTGLIALER